jgi:hypothetical protein
VHLAGVAPAFTLSQRDSEYSRKPPNALSLGRQTAQKPPFPSFSEFINFRNYAHQKHAQDFYLPCEF